MQIKAAKKLYFLVLLLAITVLSISFCMPSFALADGDGNEFIKANNKFGFGILNPSEVITINGSLALDNLSSAPTATNGWGKIYVNGNNLYFKNNLGSEFLINNGSVSNVSALDDLSDARVVGDSVLVGDSSYADDGSNNANTALGTNALDSTDTGYSNTAVGYNALTTNTSGYNNTAIGHSVLVNNTNGRNNTSVGFSSLITNSSGKDNSALGMNALQANDTGDENTAIGKHALFTNDTGDGNTAVGNNALMSNEAATYNTGLGHSALRETTDGAQNTSTGSFSLFNNVHGNYNVALGYAADRYTANGSNNVAIGFEAARGTSNFSHSNGVALGYQAGNNLTTGSNNVLLGYQAGSIINSGNGNIVIGYGINTSSATVSNELNIGNSIYGDLSTDKIGIGQTSPAVGLHIGTGSPSEATVVDASDLYVTGDIETDSDMFIADDVIVGDDIFLASELIHTSDTDTSIEFADDLDRVIIKAGGVNMLDLDQDNSKTVTGSNIEPLTDAIYDLGSSSKRYQDVYFAYQVTRFSHTTSDPHLLLDNDSTGDSAIEINNSSNTFTIGVNGSMFKISDNDTLGTNDRITIDSTGNVGIGETSPTGILQVTGNEVRIGDAGTPVAATADGDIYVEDALEVDGPIVFSAEVENDDSSGTFTVDWALGNRQYLDLDHDTATVNFNDPPGDASLILIIEHDTATADISTWESPAIEWPSGSAPSLTTSLNAVDVISCIFRSSTARYLCVPSLDFQ